MTNPSDWVRVRDTRTGHHITVTARHANANKTHLTILKDLPAVDVNGRPLPAKPHTDKNGTPTPKTSKEK